MAQLIRIAAVFTRNTSTIRKIFRFEAPILKVVHPQYPFTLTPLALSSLADDDTKDFTVESAYQYLHSVYKAPRDTGASPVLAAYPTIDSFRADFEACVAREMVEIPVDTGGHEDLMALDGVGEDLAKELLAGGFATIQSIADADLDGLESVKGIGASNAVIIRNSALALTQAATGV